MSPFKPFVKYRLLPVLCCGVLLACAVVGPDYRRPPERATESWQAVPIDGLHAGRQDLSRWWTRLADPLLTQLVGDALAANPDLQRAGASLRAARAARELASAERFPTLSGSLGASRNTSLGASRSLYQAGFDAAWEPDVFGGTRRAIEAAEADLGASEADLNATRVSLVAEVALNYVELRAYQLRLAIARDNLASQAETLQITDWRSQAGIASSLDVEQARSNRDSTRAVIPTLDTGRAEAEHRLAILTGRTPGSLHAVLAAGDAGRGTLLPRLPPDIALAIPAEVLRQRPDVLAAERRLAAETARIGQVEASRYPSFSLSGSLGLEALGLATLGAGGQVARSLAAGVSGPFFDAGRARARVAAQEAMRDQSQAAYEAAVLGALEDVQNALVALANSRERQQALASAADAARNAALLARHRYTSGLIDFQTVLTTERSLLTIEDSLASAEAERVTAVIQLYKALGGGWSPGVSPSNSLPLAPDA